MVDLVSVALLLEYEAVLTRVEFLRERGLAPAEVDAILDGLAAREGVSLNQLIATALAEKLSAQRTEDLPAERAARGDWDRVCGRSWTASAPSHPTTATSCRRRGERCAWLQDLTSYLLRSRS